jgi:hypothetical protein
VSSTIGYVAHRPSGFDIPGWAGSFDPRKARYWAGDGQARPVQAGSEQIYESREGERLWQTGDGRWIVTELGQSPAYLLTGAEAEQWFTANGYQVDDREAFARRLS